MYHDTSNPTADEREAISVGLQMRQRWTQEKTVVFQREYSF